MYLLKVHLLLLALVTIFCFGCNEQQKQSTPIGNVPQAQQPEKRQTEKVILFFGNSLTAGYGLDPEQAFPALIQRKIDSLSYHYKVVNAGVSGETTAGGNSRIDWVLQQQSIDIFILELGANDGLRGIPTEETRKNLEAIIDKVRAAEPEVKIILAGMMMPVNMGEKFGSAFKAVFPEVAAKKGVTLLPFLLEGVAGEAALNLADGIHPNALGHKIVSENVWEILKPELENHKSSS